MKKLHISPKVTRAFYKVGFTLKKHSPEILAAAGTVGVVTSAVLACKATTKVSAIAEQTKKDVKEVHDAKERGTTNSGKPYSVEDSKKDLTLIYTQTGIKYAKLYAPSVFLGTFSIGMMLHGHRILRRRNVALAAAYTAVDKGFKEYRGRVVERFGKDLDRELRYNIKAKEIEETVVDENGNEKTVVTTVDSVDLDRPSDFARFFDEFSDAWVRNAEDNLTFLKMQEGFANRKLQTQGYLFLNEVYEMLGIPKTKAGQQVGWIYDEENPVGDNYVSFGIYDGKNPENRLFVNGKEKSILLDFNVDGYILGDKNSYLEA